MSPRPQRYKEWLSVVTQKMPHLSKPQAIGLTMWSLGIAITQSCGLSTVSGFLADLFEQPRHTIRQRLRDWYKDATEKQGNHQSNKRGTLEVSASFVPLLQWIISWWPAENNRLVLAADASTDDFTKKAEGELGFNAGHQDGLFTAPLGLESPVEVGSSPCVETFTQTDAVLGLVTLGADIEPEVIGRQQMLRVL